MGRVLSQNFPKPMAAHAGGCVKTRCTAALRNIDLSACAACDSFRVRKGRMIPKSKWRCVFTQPRCVAVMKTAGLSRGCGSSTDARTPALGDSSSVHASHSTLDDRSTPSSGRSVESPQCRQSTRSGIPARSKPDVRLADWREGLAPSLSLVGERPSSSLSAPSVPSAALTPRRRRSDLRRYPP